MSVDYTLLQQENESLHKQIDAMENEKQCTIQQVEELQKIVKAYESQIQQLEQELEGSIDENIKLYETLNTSNSQKVDDAKLIGLESENKQLREVIVRLYSSFSEEKKQIISKLEVAEATIHDSENTERSELSELCGQYQTEIATLKAKLAEYESSDYKKLSNEDASFLKQLQDENNKHQEMLQLDEDIINEYSAVIEENKVTIEEKEKLLKMVASALQSVTEEKDKQEQELKLCNERLHAYKIEIDSGVSQTTNRVNLNQQLHIVEKELKTNQISVLQLKQNLELAKLSNASLQWQLSHFRQFFPSRSSSYYEQCINYSSLSYLHSIASALLQYHLHLLATHQNTLNIALFNPYSRCLLYLNQVVDLTSQYLLLLNNPHLSDKTFIQLVNDSHPPVHALLHFCEDLMIWDNSSEVTCKWDIEKDAISSLVVLNKFLSNEGKKGDIVWNRNIGIVSTTGTVTEVLLQSELMLFLLSSQLEIVKMQDIGEEQTSIEKGIITLLEALKDVYKLIQLLLKKVTDLKIQIEKDGFCGIPYINVEGEDISQKQLSHLNCIDNSALWQAADHIKQESTDVLKHISAILRPQKSILASILANHDPACIQQFIIESNSPQDTHKTLLFRIHHLYHTVKTLLSRDLFVTGIVNPSNEQPEGESMILKSEANQLKVELQEISDKTTQDRINELETALQENIIKSQCLERDILDLTSSRDVLINQLRKKKETLKLRVATSSDEELKLQQTLEKKKNEVKLLMRETAQLKKEIQEFKNKPEQRIHEEVSDEKYRLMKRTIQRVAIMQIENNLSSLPQLQFIKQENGDELDSKCDIVDVKPSLLLQAVNASIIDASMIFPSSQKQVTDSIQFYNQLNTRIALQNKRRHQQSQKGTVVSTLTLPTEYIPQLIMNSNSNNVDIVVSASCAKTIHDAIL